MPNKDGTFTATESGIINRRDKNKAAAKFIREEIAKLWDQGNPDPDAIHSLYDELEIVLRNLGELKPGEPIK